MTGREFMREMEMDPHSHLQPSLTGPPHGVISGRNRARFGWRRGRGHHRKHQKPWPTLVTLTLKALYLCLRLKGGRWTRRGQGELDDGGGWMSSEEAFGGAALPPARACAPPGTEMPFSGPK